MKVKTIPALQLLLVGAAMLAVSLWLPVLLFAFAGQLILACGLAAFGLALVVAGGVSFRRAKTTVNPINPHRTTELVVDGVYRYTRNPMYLGFLWMLFAWGIFLGSLLALIGLPIFVWIITQFQILPEEKVLAEKFGQDYQTYLSEVRRWM